jgi:alkyldihydroxyacetonephosphate synthase
LPTPPWSELERLLPGRVTSGEAVRDLWSLQTALVRDGKPPPGAGAVVRPRDVEDVSALLRWCTAENVAVVPAAGRSGVCGGVLVDEEALNGRAVVELDLRSLSGTDVDAENLRVTSLAGTPGPDHEAALEAHGLTGGHYPQSLHISTVGGWLACRSAGQFSTRYGKAEDLLSGLDVVLASGEVVSMHAGPSSAAGPDLARVFLGSEGTLGVIVRATLRVARITPRHSGAFRFASFEKGVETVRSLIQDGLRPAVVRLYDETDTAWNFSDQTGSLLILVFEGPLAAEEEAAVVARMGAAEDLGTGPGEHWLEHRFDAVRTFSQVMAPDGPLGPHAIVDTMEVAGPWSRLLELYGGVQAALEPHSMGVLCHVSHVYPDAACLYFTFAVSPGDEAEARRLYGAAWSDGLDACLASGGTITHHHGVGRLKAKWLREELGDGGWSLLRTLKAAFDPQAILNPGNLGL